MVQTGIDQEMMERQLALEEESLELGQARYDNQKSHAYKGRDVSSLQPEALIIRLAIPKVAEKINEFLQPSRGAQRMQKTKVYLAQVDPFESAFLALRFMVNMVACPPGSMSTAAFKLGDEFVQHLDYLRFKRSNEKMVKGLERKLVSAHQGHKHKVLTYARHKQNIEDTPVTKTEKVFIGQKLMELVMLSTNIPTQGEPKPLFERNLVTRTVQGEVTTTQEIHPTKYLTELLEVQHEELRLFSHYFLPTIIPPKKWTGVQDGGYYTPAGPLSVPLIKVRRMAQLRTAEQGDLFRLFEVVNTLQDTPWRINAFIHATMKEVQNSGLAGLPETVKEKILPTKPWSTDAEFEKHKKNQTSEFKTYMGESAKAHNQWARDTSKRLALLQKVWLADRFAEYDRFYFVWIADWRGRLYPLSSPFVNPQSDDTGKALIEFADGKRLGERGVYWLAIYGASEFGFDKAPLADRFKWVKEHEGYIIECAEDPLANLWWTEADNPFKFLAFCREWLGVCKLGVDFVSHLPIGLDGSCNGPQHLSTMMLDPVGCKATNIESGEQPNDLYAQVAGVVNEILAKDAESTDQFAQDMARVWTGKVNRKITKRNCMTMAYSATEFGFKEQLVAELQKLDGNKPGSYLGVENNWTPCAYLAKVNRKAISQVLIKAVEAMEWLKSVSSVVARKANKEIVWETPIGLRVHQDYRKTKTQKIETFWGGVRVQLRLQEDTVKVDTVGMNNSISPNFVHSLDASHLSTTVLKCSSVGMKHFSMVHDSFGCHASDCDTMNTLLREAFVEQYSVNQLENFRSQVVAQLPPEIAAEVPECPKPGSFDLTKVRESKYFFCC
jgi:DNA-directed RNA polymerase, mitochondrial